jgi:hypothetical protein
MDKARREKQAGKHSGSNEDTDASDIKLRNALCILLQEHDAHLAWRPPADQLRAWLLTELRALRREYDAPLAGQPGLGHLDVIIAEIEAERPDGSGGCLH